MKTPFCLFGLLGLVCGEVFAEIDAGPMQLPEGYYVPSENPYYWILKYFIKSDTLHLFY